MDPADACLLRIVKLGVVVTELLQMLYAFLRLDTQIIKPAEDDRFSWTNFGACGNESALLSIVAKRALESAAGVGERFRPAIDYAERAGDNTIAAAVANIVLHEYGTDFGADDRAGWTCLEAACFLAVFANIRQKYPAKRILIA